MNITKEQLQQNALETIFNAARLEPKGNYSAYNMYRNQIENLDLDAKKYQAAVKELAKILKI